MASEPSPSPPAPLTASGLTIPSDSENYDADANADLSASTSSPASSASPLILYQPPTLWGLLRGAAINLVLPFVNGLMLGFGELVANEAAYRLGWSGTKVWYSTFHFISIAFTSRPMHGIYARAGKREKKS